MPVRTACLSRAHRGADAGEPSFTTCSCFLSRHRERIPGRAPLRGADRQRIEPGVPGPRSPCSGSAGNPQRYYMPGADPAKATWPRNDQLFGSEHRPGELVAAVE